MTLSEPRAGGYWAQQSPININDSIHAPGLRALRFHYPNKVAGEWQDPAEEPGFSFVVATGSTAHLDFADQRCPLRKIHVHTPSEHWLDGVAYPMEIHLVHAIPRPTWGSSAVVVGIFVQVGETSPPIVHDFVHRGEPKIAGPTLDPNLCLPMRHDFFRYEGSLTTPGYDEEVSWIVLRDPLTVQSVDLEQLVKRAHHHARAMQPQQRRFVLRNFEEHIHGACGAAQ